MAADPTALAAQHAVNAKQSAAAAQSAQQATQETAADLVEKLRLTVTAPTDRWRWWQQIPAWVVIACALAGGACLIAFPHSSINQTNAWTGVIVALLVGVFLSYRSAFSLGGSSAGNPSDASGSGGASSKPGTTAAPSTTAAPGTTAAPSTTAAPPTTTGSATTAEPATTAAPAKPPAEQQ